VIVRNLEAGWFATDVKSEFILNILFPEDLISKKGDQTFILSHTLVQSVVVRFLVESESWVILQAEGDTVGKFGLTMMMAEMLEPLFPYKRATKYDVARIKFDQHNLKSDQKALLSDLSTTIAEIIKHFDTQINQLPSTASYEEIYALGDDKKWKTIENLIHAKFCVTMSRIFMDGFYRGFWLWENYHPWEFIKTALTTKEGFYTDSAFSTLELEVSTVVANLDLNNDIPDKPQKLWGFFCEGLINRMLSSWIQTFMQNESEIKRCYAEGSILRSSAVGDIVELLDLLSGLPFSLNYVPTTSSERR